MKFSILFACLGSVVPAGCYTLPTAGPSARQVVAQAQKDGRPRFDLVDVDGDVVSTLLSQPKESFRTRFQKYGRPPEPKIGIGDTVSVSIWEASGGGLFVSVRYWP